MDLIQVNQGKCTKCGICVDVCPIATLKMDEQGPKAVSAQCLACGHCVAVCPSAALNNVKTPLANQIPLDSIPVLDENAAALFLRSRRSVREFKKIPVPREKLRKLLDIARFAETSGNSQGVSYHVINDRDTLRRITSVTIDWVEAMLKTSLAGSPLEAPFAAHLANYRQNGVDVVLRDAPCLVIPIADKSSLPTGRDNTLFTLAYAELFAPSLGLGTCITGFFNGCAASGYKPLLDMLNLPENMQVTGGLIVGYPRYTYRRLVDRNPLHVTWQ